MSDMADYDMYENINNVGSVDRDTYKCGYCGKRFGTDKMACQKHVNKCEGLQDPLEDANASVGGMTERNGNEK